MNRRMVNEAYERLIKFDAQYRFSIDMASVALLLVSLAAGARRAVDYTFRSLRVCLQRRVIRTLQQPLDSGTTARRTFAAVKSRSIWLQPYFENGFPHGHDHWISAAGTSWATIALSI